MSAVVLRCANCGTAQAGLGECEACHEGQVRYFCTNHTPGQWLESPACPQCGAQFGEPARAPRGEPAPAPPPVAAPATRRPRPMTEDGDSGPWSVGPPEVDPSGYRGRVANPWAEIIAAAARAGMARRTTERDEYEAARPRGGGCLGRLMVMLLILFALFVIVPLFLGGALLQLF